MHVSTVLSFVAVAVATTHAVYSFSPEEQAIWIDRLNFFRTTGLPWSAGNMHRIGWSSELAKAAASTAAKCAATTSPGVNVYQSSATKSLSIIDEAIQQWVVETSMTTLKSVAQPSGPGVEVGKGTYNSYSQVLWAKTTSVGCATASCSGGKMVVCHFSPAGNEGSSAWYVHAPSASMCPSGTKALQNLCVTEGDAANNPIAPIPAGKMSYEVYPAYVADMQTVLIETSRGIAQGEKQEPAPPANSPSTSSTKTPATMNSADEINSTTEARPSTKTSSKLASTPKSSPMQTPQGTPSSPDGNLKPGTVKASTDTGSTFTNQVPTEQISSPDASTPNTAIQPESTPSGEMTGITNQSGETPEGGVSVVGIAGIVVLSVVGIAAFGILVSYKKNQRRQREIMRDGGIRLI